jgi:hypothetical protein
MKVSDPDRLTNSKVCHICGRQWFYMSDPHYARKYTNHVKNQCEPNKGQVKMKIKLYECATPFVPYFNKKENIDAFINKIGKRCTKKCIIFDSESTGVNVNEIFGMKSVLITTLVPITVASVIMNEDKVESKCFSIRNSTEFVNDWLLYLFDKAKGMLDKSIEDEDDEDEFENDEKIKKA